MKDFAKLYFKNLLTAMFHVLREVDNFSGDQTGRGEGSFDQQINNKYVQNFCQ